MAPGAAALEGLRFTDSRHAGDIWALCELWRALGFDELATSWRRSKCEVDVLSCLRLMVFNRLCDPGSKLGVLRWLQTVALPAGLGSVSEHQHLLRAMDVLDEYSDTLHTRLATPWWSRTTRCRPPGERLRGTRPLPNWSNWASSAVPNSMRRMRANTQAKKQ
jgi:hypothetical protein